MAMTSRERVLVAFAHEQPDRVPAWMGASPEFRELARQHLGLGDDEALSVYIGDDFRRVYAGFAGPEELDPVKGLKCPGATYRTPFGVERHGYGYGQPFDHPLTNATTLREIHDYPWPDPAWVDPSGIRAQAWPWAGQYAILGGDWSPFFHDAIDLLGMETMLVKMYEAPELVDAVLAHIVDYYVGSSQRIFDAAADVIDIFFIGNDFGTQTGPIMGQALFRRFMLPHLKRMVELGHDYGLKVMMHCCGGYFPLIPLMIEIGMDGLQSLQPSARDMEPARLKETFGDRILFNGCIDTHHVLINGTPELVRARTRQVLEVMKPGGGYVASPSHDYLLPETPVENVITMYETVREYGGYAAPIGLAGA
jgi:uroporphyrinogen decarboxylase